MLNFSFLKKVLSLFLILLLFSCKEPNNNSFSISGNIKSIKNKELILSKIEDFQKNKTAVIDTIAVNRKGGFNSVYVLKPGVFQLKFNDKNILLAIDKGQQLKIKGVDFEHLKIEGSKDTKLLKTYEIFRKASLTKLVFAVRNTIKKLKKEGTKSSKIAELRQLEVHNYQLHLEELMNFVKEKMGTSIAIYPTSTRWIGGKHLPFLDSLVVAFQSKHPNSTITPKLKKRIAILKRTSIGANLENIQLPDSTLININLKTVKGNYTLIDFWASWCPPCRTESVLLTNLYKKYHTKGFQIYSISLDFKREKWLKAIKKDNRNWVNVSSLKGFNTSAATDFGITALPFNILIDENQNIIAVNIFGEKLKQKVPSLFSN